MSRAFLQRIHLCTTILSFGPSTLMLWKEVKLARCLVQGCIHRSPVQHVRVLRQRGRVSVLRCPDIELLEAIGRWPLVGTDILTTGEMQTKMIYTVLPQ